MTREEFTTQARAVQEQLRRFLLALCCGNRDKADDITQESLIKAYLSSDRYADEGHFSAWLYKIAYRTFLDHNRRNDRSMPLEQAMDVCTDSHTPDDAFRYQELYMALDTLPERERTTLLLFYITGYSIREISLIVDCSEDAVKKQLSRGRDHLKESMTR